MLRGWQGGGVALSHRKSEDNGEIWPALFFLTFLWELSRLLHKNMWLSFKCTLLTFIYHSGDKPYSSQHGLISFITLFSNTSEQIKPRQSWSPVEIPKVAQNLKIQSKVLKLIFAKSSQIRKLFRKGWWSLKKGCVSGTSLNKTAFLWGRGVRIKKYIKEYEDANEYNKMEKHIG